MMINKKILILPAISDHIGVIQLAKSKGYEVITCDNMPLNPGHIYANKAFDIDVLDYDRLIEVARNEQIDFVWAYTTDIGALAAAKISDALGLGGNDFDVVEIMSNKLLFRSFLKQNSFNCPAFVEAEDVSNVVFDDLNFPLVVKPVDRASSKGISVIRNRNEWQCAFKYAKESSLSGKVIIEEYVEAEGCQIEAEVLVKDGKIVLCAIGDQFFSKNERQATLGTVLPSIHKASVLSELKSEIARFVDIIGYKNGGVNTEARVNKEGKVFIIELAARSGGNYILEALSFYYQVNIKEVLLSIITRESFKLPKFEQKQENVFRYEWRASGNGKLLSVKISQELNIVSKYWLKNIGDFVCVKPGADNIVAIFIIFGKSRAQVEDVYCNPEVYFKLQLVKS